jgi:hypothetical protein
MSAGINLLEQVGKLLEELLMLVELEIKDDLVEISIHQFTLVAPYNIHYVVTTDSLRILQVQFIKAQELINLVL